jgi:hypothetical protein
MVFVDPKMTECHLSLFAGECIVFAGELNDHLEFINHGNKAHIHRGCPKKIYNEGEKK